MPGGRSDVSRETVDGLPVRSASVASTVVPTRNSTMPVGALPPAAGGTSTWSRTMVPNTDSV